MLGDRSRPRIPLPKQWPSRVRSGVLHAISLAHFSLTFTRSVAANSWNARIRLREENDRLRQELALIREEMRIKDSRMLRIPAQRRPHYPPTERLSILELRAARGWSLAQTARHLLVTNATVSSWMGRLDEKGPRAIACCPETQPNLIPGNSTASTQPPTAVDRAPISLRLPYLSPNLNTHAERFARSVKIDLPLPCCDHRSAEDLDNTGCAAIRAS